MTGFDHHQRMFGAEIEKLKNYAKKYDSNKMKGKKIAYFLLETLSDNEKGKLLVRSGFGGFIMVINRIWGTWISG